LQKLQYMKYLAAKDRVICTPRSQELNMVARKYNMSVISYYANPTHQSRCLFCSSNFICHSWFVLFPVQAGRISLYYEEVGEPRLQPVMVYTPIVYYSESINVEMHTHENTLCLSAWEELREWSALLIRIVGYL
jgi:hypothetical protein